MQENAGPVPPGNRVRSTMQRRPTPVADLGVSVFLIVLCGLVLWETRKLPPGSFEPLGSAPVPRTVASLIILLCLTVIARAVGQLRRGAGAAATAEETSPRAVDAFALFLLTLAYVAVLALGLGSFAVTTSLFLTLAIWGLARFDRGALPWAIGVALVMGFGCEYLFTKVFVVDLPSGG